MATAKTAGAAAKKKPAQQELPWEEQAKGSRKPAATKAAKPAGNDEKLAARAKKAAKTAEAVPAERKYEYPEGWKAPRTLAMAADKLYETRQKRLAMQKEVDAMQEQETALKMHLLDNLPKDAASGVAGKLARVTAVSKEVPRVEDWNKVYAHIVAEYSSHKRKKDGLEDGAFSLLGRTIGKKAVEEAWNAGKVVPGVGTFTVNDISLNKV